ncbi:MAG: hypothetical protein KKH61_21405 [Gammaproteobacteria bacterium]|uniref:Putative tail fiber protein n=3 Tax=viral metagenome TaxID=1070528 RepID=A0A6M3XJ15_9ZZZZ|nr:hypothetical protein [Gammaproteobacteria bacterium]
MKTAIKLLLQGLLLGSALTPSWALPGAVLDLDFANQRGYNSKLGSSVSSLDTILTYTSPSPKMVYGNDGVLGYAPHNIMLDSNSYESARWNKLACTYTAGTATAPVVGQPAAGTMIATPGTGVRPVLSSTAYSGTLTGFVYSVSVYAKALTHSFIQFYINNQGTDYANFDLTNGVVGTTGGTVTSSIESVGNGWYRCHFSWIAGSTDRYPFIMQAASASATRAATWNPVGTESIYVGGVQFNFGSRKLDFVQTGFDAYEYSIPIDHDPVTFDPLGVLIEEQRANLLTYSEQFDNAAWAKSRATVTANAVTAPDGTVTADTLSEDGTAANSHLVSQTFSFVSGTTYTFSIFVKKANRDWFMFALPSSAFGGTSAERTVSFDLNTGAVGTSGATFTSSSIQSVGNGWYRCIATATASATSSTLFQVIVGEADGDFTFDGLSQASLYIWGAQLEVGAFATSYIPTVASQVTRAEDSIQVLTSEFAYSPDAVTIYCEAKYLGSANFNTSNRTVYELGDGTTANRMLLLNATSGRARVLVSSTAGSGMDLVGLEVLDDNTFKTAAGLSLTGEVAVNGVLVGGDGNTNMPVGATRICIGRATAANTQIDGHIKRLTYFPIRKTDAELEALSA